LQTIRRLFSSSSYAISSTGLLAESMLILPPAMLMFVFWLHASTGRLELKLHLTGSAASGLELLYDLHACIICDLAEDDVLAIEPGGDDGGDEELRAVTRRVRISTRISMI
jgi:hypothetical protein